MTAGADLAKGSKGDAVKALQEQLKAHGAKIDVDGDFGAQTDKAVREFQEAHHLKVDGIVGKHTTAALADKGDTAPAD